MRGITLHDFAKDMAAVIEKYGGGPAVMAGHAFGNFVARTTAADFPARVKAVILLGATHVWPVPPDIRASINKSHDMKLPEEERLRALKHAFFAPGNDPRVWLAGWREPPPGIFQTPLMPGTPAASRSSHSAAARMSPEPAVP